MLRGGWPFLAVDRFGIPVAVREVEEEQKGLPIKLLVNIPLTALFAWLFSKIILFPLLGATDISTNPTQNANVTFIIILFFVVYTVVKTLFGHFLIEPTKRKRRSTRRK